MAIFKKLLVGDTVATSGTRVFKKLSTELPIWNGTDLTGTTWKLRSGWTAEAGYGEFDVNGKVGVFVESLGNVAMYNFQTLRIGYAAETAFSTPHTTDNSLCWDNTRYSPAIANTNTNSTDEFTFAGGADATNPRLINWLLENGRLTSHQLDIAGTWVFNDTITELPILDDTQEDAYNALGFNQARRIFLYVASDESSSFYCNSLSMCNKDMTGTIIETKFLGFPHFMGNCHPFYYYGTNTFAEESVLSGNANNELTFLDYSKFTNFSGVYVGEKIFAWLRVNARKKDSQ